MNEPTPAPNLPAAMPTCPRCSSNARVEALAAPQSRHGRPLLDAPSPWPYFCPPCELLFTGTEDEFVRMWQLRDKYREAQAKRQVPGGVR